MADDTSKLIVDDDWKAQARKEKERLAEETEARRAGPGSMPAGGFSEVVNLIVMQAMVGLGLLQGPAGERIPPNLAVAKHFIDLLQVLDDKTKGNLTPEEKRLLDQVLYEMRITYVQMTGGGGMPGVSGATAAGSAPAARIVSE